MKRNKGFTLVEAMIVVVIIGILAGIGYPTYQQHLRDTRRGDAQRAMEMARSFIEKFNVQCSSYTLPGTANPPPFAPNIQNCNGLGVLPYNADPNRYYNITLDGPPTSSSTTYTIRATPLGAQTADVDCLQLTLDQTGAKGQTGPNVSNKCWRR